MSLLLVVEKHIITWHLWMRNVYLFYEQDNIGIFHWLPSLLSWSLMVHNIYWYQSLHRQMHLSSNRACSNATWKFMWNGNSSIQSHLFPKDWNTSSATLLYFTRSLDVHRFLILIYNTYQYLQFLLIRMSIDPRSLMAFYSTTKSLCCVYVCWLCVMWLIITSLLNPIVHLRGN